MPTVTNISTYKFAPLADLKPLRERLIAQCQAWGLKGTILLSTEGINLFVAGPRAEIDLLIAELRSIPGLETLTPKISLSEHQPFNRMLVRIKKEIIAFGVEGIDPGRRTSPKLPAKELKRWLDEGRPVTLLDTRNDYEVRLGTFKNALPAGISNFREFPDAVSKLPEEMKQQPIVMFCTGGIRCEKAGPYMEREGFQQIFQLDGGILKYFEECGGEHYDGECFVFDQRVGVDPTLQESDNEQCFVCLTPLTFQEQRDPRYVPGKSCPYCFETDEQQRARVIEERHAVIRRATTPLPGSAPYDNERPLRVPEAFDGFTMLNFLSQIFSHVPRDEWQRLIDDHCMLDATGQPVGADHVIHVGEKYVRLERATSEPDVNADIRILYEDEAIVVLHKPAPLPIHASGRFHRNTLQHILAEVYAPQNPRPAHRLDANTTGIVVFARTRHFASLLQPQFQRGEVEKTYVARVQGHPPEDSFVCEAPISEAAGVLGSREIDEESGLPSRTEFHVLERFEDGTALLEVNPLTGRTNQIRVHLWLLGWPICGDQVYLPDQTIGTTQTQPIDAEPLCLMSRSIKFTHPLKRERVEFSTELPSWAEWVAATPETQTP